MGRRALRKIDPNLDISPLLITVDELPGPCIAAALFGREAPVVVEVGSGKGLFISTAAAMDRDRDFLGIEISRKYARFAAARLVKRNLANARILHGDARLVFGDLMPDDSLAEVHVYFPDPWWKKRHKKRRVMNTSFVKDVERKLVPGGTLHFWTDVEEYFQTTLDLLSAATRFAGPCDVPEPPETGDMDYRTHFERRMRLNRTKVYRAQFRKGATAADGSAEQPA